MQFEREARAQDVRAEIAGRARFFERRFEHLVDFPDLAVNIVVADGNAHRIRADRHAFDQRMRVPAQDVAILERARLAFVRIADEILLPGKLTRHEAPLQAGREARTAAATQARRLHVGNHLLRGNLFFEDPAQLLVAAARDVVFEMPVLAVQAGENQRFDVTIVERRHFESSSINWSIFSRLMKLHMRWLFTSSTGASPHEPKHSPSFKVNLPSAVVSPKSMPSFCFRYSRRAVRAAVRAELARQVRAERDLVLADRRRLVHRVERRDFLHGDGRHAEIVGDELHQLGRQPAMLFLSGSQRRHHRGLLLLRGIFRDRTIDFFQAFS